MMLWDSTQGVSRLGRNGDDQRRKCWEGWECLVDLEVEDAPYEEIKKIGFMHAHQKAGFHSGPFFLPPKGTGGPTG